MSGTVRRPIFSDVVDQLATSKPPDDGDLQELLRTLRAVLVIELKRRGIWWAPPAFLRVIGQSWTANGGEALAELTQSAYLYIFAERLNTLIEGRRRGLDVGPLVIRMVRQFVSKQQRLADPIGYCVYTRLKEAVLQMIDGKDLYRGKAEPRMHNRTVLAFQRLPNGNALVPAEGESLVGLVGGWSEELLPELVTALGKAVRPVVTDLRRRIQSLEGEGIVAFRFGDLVAPLRDEVRRRWHAVRGEVDGEVRFLASGEDGETSESVLVTWPEHPVEYESLLDCVTSSIDRHDPGHEQEPLWRLWLMIRGVTPYGDEPRPVSVAGVSKLIDLSRRQVGKLQKILRSMVSACLSAFEIPSDAPQPDSEDPLPRAQSVRRFRR